MQTLRGANAVVRANLTGQHTLPLPHRTQIARMASVPEETVRSLDPTGEEEEKDGDGGQEQVDSLDVVGGGAAGGGEDAQALAEQGATGAGRGQVREEEGMLRCT